jgi:Na+/H+ antiporter NhaD/arsenite permease-like protein
VGLLAAVFGAIIVRQVTGRGPPVWAIFLAGAFVTVASGVLSPAGAESSIAASAPVILFLFALFLFAGALDRAGALDHLGRWIVGRAREASDLPVVLFVGFGIASAFLVNDALVLIGVPLLIGVAARVRADPKPLLLVLAFSVTVGSALTPFGNPQNLLISISSGLTDPVSVFLRYLLLPTAINLAIGAWYLRRVFARSLNGDPAAFAEVRTTAPPLLPETGWPARLYRSPVLWVFPGTLLVVITLDVTAALTGGPSIPIWETAGAGAVVLLLVSTGRTQIVQRVDWTVLLLFAGLFVVVGGAEAGGVVSAAQSLLPIPPPSQPVAALGAIVATSIAGPQIVSNVPWVALQIPLLTGLGYGSATPIPWVALAAASTLAGNVTLLGAASNLIVAELSEKAGIPFRLGPFVRFGLPLAALTTAVVTACLYFGV